MLGTTMYICNDCHEVFIEDDLPKMETTYGEEYGAYDPIGRRLVLAEERCPYCLSDDISEYFGDDDE